MLAVFAKAGDPLSAGRNIPGGCYSYRALKIAPVSQVVASWVPKASGIAYGAKLRRESTSSFARSGRRHQPGRLPRRGQLRGGAPVAGRVRLREQQLCHICAHPPADGNSDVADRAAGYGIPGVTVDGTDVPPPSRSVRMRSTGEEGRGAT